MGFWDWVEETFSGDDDDDDKEEEETEEEEEETTSDDDDTEEEEKKKEDEKKEDPPPPPPPDDTVDDDLLLGLDEITIDPEADKGNVLNDDGTVNQEVLDAYSNDDGGSGDDDDDPPPVVVEPPAQPVQEPVTTPPSGLPDHLKHTDTGGTLPENMTNPIPPLDEDDGGYTPSEGAGVLIDPPDKDKVEQPPLIYNPFGDSDEEEFVASPGSGVLADPPDKDKVQDGEETIFGNTNDGIQAVQDWLEDENNDIVGDLFGDGVTLDPDRVLDPTTYDPDFQIPDALPPELEHLTGDEEEEGYQDSIPTDEWEDDLTTIQEPEDTSPDLTAEEEAHKDFLEAEESARKAQQFAKTRGKGLGFLGRISLEIDDDDDDTILSI